MSDRRVVVTGMGALTPFGVGVDVYWDGLVAGRSGIAPIERFDVTDFDVKFGGEVQGFDISAFMDRREAKRLDRYAQFAVGSCAEARKQAGENLLAGDPRRVSVIFGTGIGGLSELEDQHARLLQKGPGKVSAFTIPKLMPNAGAGNVSIMFGARGNSIDVSSACASATHAMGEALRAIRSNDADVVFTGGSEAALTPLALAAFASMKALSTRNDDPQTASRPFDRGRDGFVLGEGAGALVFEELEHAKKRGATILAEVVGFGASSDADHITQPREDGEGACDAMRMALADGMLDATSVSYINAHGTSTPLGDIAETVAIKKVFGDHAKKLTVSSTKSAVGHSLGASGGTEMIAMVMALQNGVIPPTINLHDQDDACDLDYCPNTARDAKIDVAMSNSFGFGGHNACIAIRRCEG